MKNCLISERKSFIISIAQSEICCNVCNNTKCKPCLSKNNMTSLREKHVSVKLQAQNYKAYRHAVCHFD